MPYHVYPFIFPLNKYAYILLFIGVNVWTILIRATAIGSPDQVA